MTLEIRNLFNYEICKNIIQKQFIIYQMALYTKSTQGFIKTEKKLAVKPN